MNKFKFVFCFLLMILVFPQISGSQTKFHFYVYGGLSVPVGDFNQVVPLVDTVREDWPYQTKIAYNLGAMGMFPLDKKEKWNLTFGLTYTAFRNNIAVVVPGSSTGGGLDNEVSPGGNVNFNPKIDLFTLSLGAGYDFSPKNDLHPMLSLEATGNFFSGSFNFDATSSAYTSANLKSSFRLGLQFGGALEYKINPNYGLYGGIKYNLANLIGRTADNSTQTASIALGDKEHSENGVTRSSKTISYFQISVGLALYLNGNSK